ncbi:MAG: TonB-dependent receptor [Alistipes sp.]|nr:TonB-dependent receptor [Alistipes sp.]
MLIKTVKGMRTYICILLGLLLSFSLSRAEATEPPHTKASYATLSGVVLNSDGEPLPYATVYVAGTTIGTTTDIAGRYTLSLSTGEYAITASTLGFENTTKHISISHNDINADFTLDEAATRIEEVVVSASGVGQLRRSAFNAVAINAQEFQNTSKNLSDALAKAPGVKLRESGGVGSDVSISLDGFTGKHVKIFIDGVPQEGVGGSFSLNNIPAGFADRIEVYRGVVPVGFGADAIGGVVNIVTSKNRRRWYADASYSFGSFNTHRSTINAGQSFENGVFWDVNAFQNYSDNNYSVDASVEDFETGRIDKLKKERVERFHDTYHNEAIVAKFGVAHKRWADRLALSMTYSQMYKEIQTGVRQDVVYGDKYRRGYTLMPSLEYLKRNIIVEGLDLSLTASYNRNIMTNVDTAQYKYNWRGERKRLNSPGEQSLMHTRSENDNWSATATLNYRISRSHTLTLNHVFSAFTRSNTSLLASEPQRDAINKQTIKNITGLQYRYAPTDSWNISAFAKYYALAVSGPMATDANATDFVRTSRSSDALGYGLATTYFITSDLQAKLSYEKAFRLPTIEEMFGDEDLEMGEIGLRPERSDNVNFNLSYTRSFGQSLQHSIYVEGGAIFRNTNDYIQRNIVDLSGGKVAASYINYGKVRTWGANLSARYSFAGWLSVGGNLTYSDVRDNMKIAIGTTSMPNLGYGDRMPNVPYLFADADVSFTWRDCITKGDALSITYDNQYLRGFYYYSSRIGTNKSEYMVPDQFSHNLSLGYSLCNGKYNLSIECRNFTNEKLYDNFSLQRAGRAFYAKLRVSFGGR